MAEEQKPTRNLREFYQAQPPIGDTIRGGMERAFPNTVAQGRDVQAKVGQAYDRGGLISAASEANKRALQPAIGVAQDVASSVGAVGRLLNPFAKPANAQTPKAAAPSAPAAAPKPSIQQQVGVGTLGLTQVAPGQLWNTPLNQNKLATPSAARSRPAVPRVATTAAKPVNTAPAASPATVAAQPNVGYATMDGRGYTAAAPGGIVTGDAAKSAFDAMGAAPNVPEGEVQIIRGIGPSGSTIAQVDGNTGQILTAQGGTDTYRPFEGQYMTQEQQDLITANRLKVGDPMTAGQAGAISKQAALLAGDAARNAAAIEQQRMQVEGGIAQQRISTGGAITQANIAHGETNKLKAMEAKAIAALDDALKSGDAAAIGLAQQRLAAIRGGTGTEFAPLNVYDDMGNVIGQRLYNKKNGVVQGDQPGAEITQDDIAATARKHGITEQEVVTRLKAEGRL